VELAAGATAGFAAPKADGPDDPKADVPDDPKAVDPADPKPPAELAVFEPPKTEGAAELAVFDPPKTEAAVDAVAELPKPVDAPPNREPDEGALNAELVPEPPNIEPEGGLVAVAPNIEAEAVTVAPKAAIGAPLTFAVGAGALPKPGAAEEVETPNAELDDTETPKALPPEEAALPKPRPAVDPPKPVGTVSGPEATGLAMEPDESETTAEIETLELNRAARAPDTAPKDGRDEVAVTVAAPPNKDPAACDDTGVPNREIFELLEEGTKPDEQKAGEL